MPPFRVGLLKRKNISAESKVSSNEESFTNKNQNEEDSEDLIRGECDDPNDVTDSEHEEDVNVGVSDDHIEEVMFGDDIDSTLGDEEASENSDQSSELTDSEADTEESDSEDDRSENESDLEESTDSGAESGLSHTRSSDEADKKLAKQKKKKQSAKSFKENQFQTHKEYKSSIDSLSDKVKNSCVSTQPVEQKDEYESGDTSDEEDRRNTCGEVPRWWYDEYPHIGYDLDGRRIIKPPQRDHIDEFLRRCEDPDFWRTVKDPSTGQDVTLSKDDLELIHRLREGRAPDPAHDEYQPWVEWFSRSVLAAPLRAFPDHKRSFLPSRSEQKQISRIVHALKMGWTKTRKQLAEERNKNKEKRFYNLWGSEAEPARGIQRHIPAPRRPLPAHAESYNPPPEYLLDAREMKEWNELAETPWKRKYSFLPARWPALRAVPAHARFVRERFLRCLDLYLAPRAIKMRLTIGAADLLPRLPHPRDLQPFPTREALQFRGHGGAVRALHVAPDGQHVATGGDDGTLRVWETATGRCVRTVDVGGVVARGGVAWGPAAGLRVVGVAVGRRLLLLCPGPAAGTPQRTERLLRQHTQHDQPAVEERVASCAQWEHVGADEWARGVRVAVTHFQDLVHMAWHARGDYVCVTLGGAAGGGARSVAVHQVSRRRTQLPFRRPKGLVQCALFHPSKPWLFVATQRAVRIYDLVRQEMVRKLQPGAQWNSTMAIHPSGDHLLVASYDSKCLWFDLELSARPYQALRVHGRAVRALAFHPRYPLFASAGDDKYIVVSHGMVYNDLLQNPLLVPLKQLPSGSPCDSLVTLDLCFHPTQPWLLAACADSVVRLYS